MHAHDLSEHAHHHDLAPVSAVGERRTRWVVGLTLVMMVGEIVAGQITGSMALTADGWHMATHAGALGLALFAYWFARTRADSRHFTFGTGKVSALAGFASAVVLAVVALWMGVEAARRLYQGAPVDFADALPVAVLGLGVNLLSAWLLWGAHDHGPGHHGHGHDRARAGHDHDHTSHGHHAHSEHGPADEPARADRGHAHGEGHGHRHAAHDHDHDHDHDDGDHHRPKAAPDARPAARKPAAPASGRDHNLRAAYLHVVADALTSVLAIVALVAGYYAGAWYLDPLMGLVGGAVIARWSIGLCRDTAAQLLDAVPSTELAERIERRLEADGDARVADLHLWELAPGRHGCIVALVAAEPRAVDHYRTLILAEVELAHLTVEIHRCQHGHDAPIAA